MFNNKFLKHDPLVEAVKQAQQDGNDRRLAEAMTNELFGVYSRNAVIRENISDYDFALEEAYKCMKEAEKMADKDYDGDGEIETSKKEVWGSRLRAAKASGKYKGPVDEGAVDAGDYEGSKSLTKSAPKEDPSLPKSYPGAASSAPTAQRLSNAKAAIKESEGTAAVQNLKHRDFKETRHPNPGAVTKAPVPGVSIAEEDQLDELSRKTLGSYIKKAADDSSYHSFVAGGELGKRGNSNLRLASDRKAMKRLAGVNKAADKLAKEDYDQLDEVSKGAAISAYRGKEAEDRSTTKLRNLIRKKWGEKTVHHAERAGAADTGNLVRKGESHGTDYLSRAKSSSDMRKTKSGKVHKQDVESKKSEIKFRKTMSKFDKPRGHLPEEHIDEAAYSAKAARSGKDIAKRGKMFSKIAKKAGERYGSEERGQKVAGAILKRIRAKHMKEDQSF